MGKTPVAHEQIEFALPNPAALRRRRNSCDPSYLLRNIERLNTFNLDANPPRANRFVHRREP